MGYRNSNVYALVFFYVLTGKTVTMLFMQELAGLVIHIWRSVFLRYQDWYALVCL